MSGNYTITHEGRRTKNISDSTTADRPVDQQFPTLNYTSNTLPGLCSAWVIESIGLSDSTYLAIERTTSMEQLPLTSEQERQVLEWVSKEKYCGTVVRKEVIHWFAEQVIRRDGNGDKLVSDFADRFLDRHPNLAKTLTVAPPPSRMISGSDKTKRVGAFDRLKEKMQRDRTEALYGQNAPPPPREHAPFPEGDMIYQCNQRHVVRHGKAITKYTTSSDGMGVNDQPNEASVLRFVREHTTIPVPEVISSDWDRVTMEYVEGQTLRQA